MGSVCWRCVALVALLSACGRSDFRALTVKPFGATAVAAGWFHGLATTDEATFGAGQNASHQITGDASFLDVLTAVERSEQFVDVQAGEAHSCARTASGTVWCWGASARGQVGQGDTADYVEPTMVPLPGNATSIAAHDKSSCALLSDDRLFCWGYNFENGFAQPTLGVDALAPVEIMADGRNAWQSVGIGQGHLCAVDVDGALWCSGRNNHGQVALDPSIVNQVTEMTRVGTQTDWWFVNAGSDSTCALRGGSPGELYCWGLNGEGQAAQGTTTDVFVPSRVGNDLYTSVVSSTFVSCATTGEGTLSCWGRNDEGQLGLGDGNADVLTPTRVLTSRRNIVAVAVGRFHTCAAMADGELWCTGQNAFGQLGLGDLEPRRVWTEVRGE